MTTSRAISVKAETSYGFKASRFRFFCFWVTGQASSLVANNCRVTYGRARLLSISNKVSTQRSTSYDRPWEIRRTNRGTWRLFPAEAIDSSLPFNEPQLELFWKYPPRHAPRQKPSLSSGVGRGSYSYLVWFSQ